MLSALKARLETLSSRQESLVAELEPRNESRLLDFYVRLIPRVLDAERCSVFIHDPASGKVWLKAGTGVVERGIEVGMRDSIAGQVISAGKPMLTWDLEGRDGAHRLVDTTTGFVTRQVVCVPIRSTDGARVTGAIQALNKRAGRFTEDDQAFLAEVAEHFQGIVEGVYLGQEALSLGKNAVHQAGRAALTSVVAASAVVFVVTVLSVFGGLPLLLFG